MDVIAVAQKLQDQPALRIKFASRAREGGPRSDATDDDYKSFMQQAPKGWSIRERGYVSTQTGGYRPAWVLEADSLEIAVIAHEDGAEILRGAAFLATQAASALVNAALIGAATLMWKRWKSIRAPGVAKGSKVPSSIVIERRDTRRKDGSMASTLKLEIPGPVSTKDLEAALAAVGSFEVARTRQKSPRRAHAKRHSG